MHNNNNEYYRQQCSEIAYLRRRFTTEIKLKLFLENLQISIIKTILILLSIIVVVIMILVINNTTLYHPRTE